MTLLRFFTCGSVDDGKSTLLGRLLHDARLVPEDELEKLRRSAGASGSGGIDYASLLDGLSAEREQGITIDVAYRYFITSKRAFIAADTPGHEQYTRNMVTGASDAELGLLLVDARQGLITQTRRHLRVAALMRVPSVVLAVNKMDLVGYSEEAFRAVEAAFEEFGGELGFRRIAALPVSALAGVNLTARSPETPWYQGLSLLEVLEGAALGEADEGPFRMPVQWVNRHGGAPRAYCGTIAGGSVLPGDRIGIYPGGRITKVDRILTTGGDLPQGLSEESVALTFAEETDCTRGDVLASPDEPPGVADHFEASIVWMDEEPLLPGRSYLMKIGTATVPAAVTELKYEVNVDSGEHIAAKTLGLNAIGVANVSVIRPIAFESYERNRNLGGFILIDRISNATAGAGVIHCALRRSRDVVWQPVKVDRESLAALKGQRARVVWFTGLSGAGKSTIANLVQQKLHALGRHTALLDGDNLRHGLNKDLGFSDEDRVENVRRAGEVAKLMADAGLIVLCAFISPFRAERRMIRDMLPPGEFIEVFVDVALEEAERRDPKGLYLKARRGQLPNFTGVDSPYETPEKPDLRIDTMRVSEEEAAAMVVKKILG